jgi:hypothetical protein
VLLNDDIDLVYKSDYNIADSTASCLIIELQKSHDPRLYSLECEKVNYD